MNGLLHRYDFHISDFAWKLGYDIENRFSVQSPNSPEFVFEVVESL